MTKPSNFRALITGVASLASIIGIGIAGYQLGRAGSEPEGRTWSIEIQNSLASVLSSLPVEEQPEAREILDPIAKLAAATGSDDPGALDEAKSLIHEALANKPPEPYQAEKSPFVPPLHKVQFLCDDQFLLTYDGKAGLSSILVFGTQRKPLGRRSLRPGEVTIVESEDVRLILTVLEYREDLKGPVVKYSCDHRS